MNKPKAVLAGNRPQFMNYLRETNTDPKDAVFVFGPRDVLGREFREIVYYGSWYELPDSAYLNEMARSRVR